MRRTMVGLVFSESPPKKKRNHHRDLRNRTFSGLNTLEDGMRELPITSKLIINVDCSAVHKLCPTGYTRVDTLSMKSPCTHRGCRDLVFASVEDVTEKLPTFLLVDILGCGFDWNAVADQLSTHFQYCS